MKTTVAIALLIALALSTVSALAETKEMYVCRYRVHVFMKKTIHSGAYKMLDYGDKVKIEEHDGDWYGIKVKDKKTGKNVIGWVQGKSLSKTNPKKKKATATPKPTKKPKKAKETPRPTPVPAPTINRKEIDRVLLSMQPVQQWLAVIITESPYGTVALRREPTVQGQLIYHLETGHQLTVLAEGDGWYQVRDDEGQRIGYMASRFLRPVNASNYYNSNPFAFSPVG